MSQHQHLFQISSAIAMQPPKKVPGGQIFHFPNISSNFASVFLIFHIFFLHLALWVGKSLALKSPGCGHCKQGITMFMWLERHDAQLLLQVCQFCPVFIIKVEQIIRVLKSSRHMNVTKSYLHFGCNAKDTVLGSNYYFFYWFSCLMSFTKIM